MGLVTAESANASTLRLDFAPRFFEPLPVDPKSEILPT
jgi:hypothetical protein